MPNSKSEVRPKWSLFANPLTYNWTDFFAPRLKKISGIKKFHHFRVSSLSPGLVFAKQWSDSPEVTFQLLKEPWTPAVDELPAVVPLRAKQ